MNFQLKSWYVFSWTAIFPVGQRLPDVHKNGEKMVWSTTHRLKAVK